MPARAPRVRWGPQLRRLQRQLDLFGEEDVFLRRFEMLGRQHRRKGGQGLVQFVECRRDFSAYAVKFFFDYDTFLNEAALYAAAFPYLRGEVSRDISARAATVAQLTGPGGASMAQVAAGFLPQVEAVCDGAPGGLQDPRGGPLPPCIVMEKGESLHDWSDRAEPDLFMSLAVLSNISLRLADMHDAGYVHRDLKPANVMWLPRQNRWTVIDFGCVARAGEHAPLSFTLVYAAPEAAVALQLQRDSIVARPALDAWSLGVMAFELLTAAPAFDLLAIGSSQVMEMLTGRQPLPWEGELSAALRRKLGALHRPILQLLHRDPAQRAAPRTLHAACTSVFSSRSTVEV